MRVVGRRTPVGLAARARDRVEDRALAGPGGPDEKHHKRRFERVRPDADMTANVVDELARPSGGRLAARAERQTTLREPLEPVDRARSSPGDVPIMPGRYSAAAVPRAATTGCAVAGGLQDARMKLVMAFPQPGTAHWTATVRLAAASVRQIPGSVDGRQGGDLDGLEDTPRCARRNARSAGHAVPGGGRSRSSQLRRAIEQLALRSCSSA